ncbi:RmlC-like cupin domain-containing protein [Jimgerdemannia flammicorona]|uniref:RmlC-like cupin domain-containing protein n=1 Tax=Jimgerdemannia flammicorona TaxID=994334 RepID=A0A433Q7J2_9FUNG|nr:RmlC-like cupin domain-containing protein [Jimgerdemannia flammicorona]
MPATIVSRRSDTRGHANHGWLNTYHTFSFANYYDSRYEQFGSLRVINEDIVQPGEGFGKHPHKEYEIFSYILSGELEHKDSFNNYEVLKRGDVQFTTAGTGISHSEHNAAKSPATGSPVNFLQIWVRPDDPRLKPAYYTKHFSDASKLNNLVHILSPADSDRYDPSTIGIHTDFHMYASLLQPGETVSFKVNENVKGGDALRRVYVHVANTADCEVLVKAGSGATVALKKGDGAFVTEIKQGEELSFVGAGEETAEFVVFDLV